MTVMMDAEALNAFLARDFPQVAGSYRVEQVEETRLVARLVTEEEHLRPGGTVSGPSMFALADLAIYCAILARIGPVALAVTTNASIDFMRKPAAGRDLLAECRLLKLGRVLAVAEVLIFSEGQVEPVARCSMTYSIPPKPRESVGVRYGI
ncbi:PaaI family thioesterase [Paracoccus sp. T5]|uniref:PaaI family thioesterase n=1 Tax=Paracoccus sp. T5 TaxID=3402161 RepID=UPI003AD86F9E